MNNEQQLSADKLFTDFLERCGFDINKMSKIQYDAMKDSFYVGISTVFVIEKVCPEKDLPKVVFELQRDVGNYFMLRSISEN